MYHLEIELVAIDDEENSDFFSFCSDGSSYSCDIYIRGEEDCSPTCPCCPPDDEDPPIASNNCITQLQLFLIAVI